MKSILSISLVIAAVFCMSCSNSNQSNKQENSNVISEAAIESDSQITACQHASKIYWRGTKPAGEHSGIIKLKSGNYFVNDNELVGGEFIIDMNSIINIDIEDENKNTKLVSHLKSADFFNVDTFPEGKFIITGVEQIVDNKFSHKIIGELTLLNIKQEVSFKAMVNVKEGVVSATSEEFSINRTLWGVNYKSKSIFSELADKFINDEFFLRIEAYSM